MVNANDIQLRKVQEKLYEANQRVRNLEDALRAARRQMHELEAQRRLLTQCEDCE